MINWLRKILGIADIDSRLNKASNAIKRIDRQLRTGRRPQRRDEIERARKRRYKRAA